MKFLLLLEHSLIMLFWVLLIFGFDTTYTAILTIASALIHEFGHILCLFFVNSKSLTIPKTNLSGFRIKLPSISYKQELACAISGPLANLTVAFLSFLLNLYLHSPYLETFEILNALTAFSNLIPIEEYDGYKILLAVFSPLKALDTIEYWLRMLSLIISAAFTLLSLYVMLKIGEGYWFFGVFFTLTLRSVIKNQKANFF